MSTTVPELTTLLRQTHLSPDHETLLKAANAALRKSKTDVTAQKTRVVALLNLNRYSEVVTAFENAGKALKDEAPLEYAYALYKTEQWNSAREVAEKYGERNRGLAHLAGQTVSIDAVWLCCADRL